MSISETAMAFFDACETGKGWNGCQQWCHEGATFSCQADALAEITTLQGYTEWTAWIMGPIPDLAYEIQAAATDAERGTVIVQSVVTGSNTGEGEGAPPPTGQKAVVEYVYAIKFDGDKISHMTKVWNDGYTLKQLGWA